MANPYFQFKQFTIWHDHCAMKVNTDSVLLGSWVKAENPVSILDIGAGSGLLSLMMAQRFDANVEGVEIDENAYLQAVENGRISPWKDRISFYQVDFLQFFKETSHRYDLIISNPPYFSNALRNPDGSKMNARHNDILPVANLMQGVKKLLKENGTFAVVQPVQENAIDQEAILNGLYCYRKYLVKPNPAKDYYLCLSQYGHPTCALPETSELVIQDAHGYFTPAYRELTKDFYLKF